MITSDIQEFCRLLKDSSPILSIDFGTKKLGVAVSTPNRTMSIIVGIIEPKLNLLIPILEQYKPCAIVMGLPVNMDGTSSSQNAIVQNFATKLFNAFALPIFLQDERLTSRAASNLLKDLGLNRKERDKRDDQVAAAIILDTALESINKTNINTLPEGFVYLHDMDSSIIQNIQYATAQNFVGTKITGYNNNTAIVTIEAALKLQLLQQELQEEGLSLVIYDAYRPTKAVQHFAEWSQDHSEQKMKQLYYPRVNKEDLFELGYINYQSFHSSGSALDLSIIEDQSSFHTEPLELDRTFTDGFTFTYLYDGTVDMGSHFDLFDIASHHDSKIITNPQLAWRNFLRNKMHKHGFRSAQNEWWHYELIDEPFAGKYFDFDVS
jgi:D-alanyl-D-alanine dipeptidase